jgi:hypothetical protein
VKTAEAENVFDFICYHIAGDIDRRPLDFGNARGAMQTNDLG